MENAKEMSFFLWHLSLWVLQTQSLSSQILFWGRWSHTTAGPGAADAVQAGQKGGHQPASHRDANSSSFCVKPQLLREKTRTNPHLFLYNISGSMSKQFPITWENAGAVHQR